MRGVSNDGRRRIAAVPSRQQQWPRGPVNDLHRAARAGSVQVIIALLAHGSINIDLGDPKGWTPLMLAAFNNFPSCVGVLLSNGANVQIPLDSQFTALHFSIQEGNLAVVNLLMGAGADLGATVDGYSPLHLAVGGTGHPRVATALIHAGAEINHREPEGATPLYAAAWDGNVECVRALLRANADPLLSRAQPMGRRCTPLDAAAQNGHADVARELIPRLGKEVIGGGASAGVTALRLAAQYGHVNVMTVMTDAGVVDTGNALCGAAGFGNVATVSYLLRKEQESEEPRERLYANSRDDRNCLPLLQCITNCRPCSPKIARLLIDAGADTTTAFRVDGDSGSKVSRTLLSVVVDKLVGKKVNGKDASEEQLHALEAIRRLLLQVEAARAVSWVWPDRVPASAEGAGGPRRADMASTIECPLTGTMPTMRLTATRQRVLWAALSRWGGVWGSRYWALGWCAVGVSVAELGAVDYFPFHSCCRAGQHLVAGNLNVYTRFPLSLGCLAVYLFCTVVPSGKSASLW